MHDLLPGLILYAKVVMLCVLGCWLQRQQLQGQGLAVVSGCLFGVL